MVESTPSKSIAAAAFREALTDLAEPKRTEVLSLLDDAQSSALTPTKIRIAFSKAGRVAGNSAVALSSEKQERLGVPAPLEGWCADELARIAVLLSAVPSVAPDQQVSLVETLYRTGGEREQRSLLHVLSLLPEAERYADLAAEATRTNAVSVFAALACENPFPAQHLPELNFNQMVMKAIFLELDTQRVVNLRNRVTAELVRMLNGHANEVTCSPRTGS